MNGIVQPDVRRTRKEPWRGRRGPRPREKACWITGEEPSRRRSETLQSRGKEAEEGPIHGKTWEFVDKKKKVMMFVLSQVDGLRHTDAFLLVN